MTLFTQDTWPPLRQRLGQLPGLHRHSQKCLLQPRTATGLQKCKWTQHDGAQVGQAKSEIKLSRQEELRKTEGENLWKCLISEEMNHSKL